MKLSLQIVFEYLFTADALIIYFSHPMKGNFPSVLIIIKKVKTLSIEVQNLIKKTIVEFSY